MRKKHINYLVVLLPMIFNSCNYFDVPKEENFKYIQEENPEVLKEIFQHRKDLVSRSSVKISLHKIKNDDFVEEVADIFWYNNWSFDTLKNEYIPKGEMICEVKNYSLEVFIKQAPRIKGIQYDELEDVEEWYHAIHLGADETKRKGVTITRDDNTGIKFERGWSFTKAIEFTYKKVIDKDGLILLKAKNMIRKIETKKLPTHTEYYYCKYEYSNQLISPNNDEFLRFSTNEKELLIN